MTTYTRLSRPKRTRHARRGLAMMLALVAVAVGTVIAAAALTMNDNASQIGRNAVAHTSSEWSAHAASELVVAAMQTETDWRKLITNGVLLDDWTFADANVDVQVTNIEGGAVSEADREVLLTIVADVNGVRTVVEKQVSLAPISTFGNEIDASLGEFAIFARNSLRLHDGATLRVWPQSPEAKLRPEFKIGTTAETTGDLKFDNPVEFKNVHLYVVESSSAGVKGMISDARLSGGLVLPDVIPCIATRTRAADASHTVVNTKLLWNSGLGDYMAAGARFDELEIVGGSTFRINGASVDHVVVGKLLVDAGSRLLIEGNVRLVVEGDFDLMNASVIELGAGASLEMLIGGHVTIDESVIGGDTSLASDIARQVFDLNPIDPRRIRLHAISELDGGNGASTWLIDNSSIVVGSIHAATADFTLKGGSGFVGRVSANQVDISESAALFYEPRFDNRMGFTDPKSPMYDESGDIRPEYEPTIYFMKTIAEKDSGDMSNAERMLLKLYYADEDQAAFKREITSVLLDADLRRTGDDVENPFTIIATDLYSVLRSYVDTRAAINTLMDEIAPSNTVDVDAMLTSDQTFVDGLSDMAKTILGVLKGPKAAEEEVKVEDPKIDALGPDLDGNFTVRRAGKARARSIEDMYADIEEGS